MTDAPIPRTPKDDAAMSFAEIGKRIGMTTEGVRVVYKRAIRKLRSNAAVTDALIELTEYHHQLRARSAECRAAQEHW